MNDLIELARSVRPLIEKAAQNGLTDQEALQAKTLAPSWESLVKKGSVEAESGFRFRYGDKLFKCVNADPTFPADWVPGVNTAALYTQIDEEHAGTLADPIPYEGNMELAEGTYYSQDGVTYLCSRGTGAAVFNPLAELVGIYVEVAEA